MNELSNPSHAAIQKLADESPVQAQIRDERGAPRLFIDGQETYPLVAWSWSLRQATPWFRRAGVTMLQPVFGLNAAWPNPDTYDWREYEGVMASLLELHPDAYFLPRVLLDVPGWWRDRYPDELVQCAAPLPEDREPYRPIRRNPEGGWLWGLQRREPSFASTRYREDLQRQLRAFVRHMEASPFSSRILGYQIGSGIYGEWHYFLGQYCPDVSQPMRDRLGFVPDLAQRTTTTHGLFRDPATESATIEFYRRFHEEVCAETILEFTRIVKAESADRLLCGVFYTYLLENVFIHEMGHLAPQKILEADHIDFIASPYSYQASNVPGAARGAGGDVVDGGGNLLGRARGVGGDGGYRVLGESLKRHGKLYFAELDANTYLEPRPADPDGPDVSDVERELYMIGGSGTDTFDGALRVLKRDLGQVFARGNGGWLFDFGPVLNTKDSWYADTPITDLVSKSLALGKGRTDLDLTSIAQIAAVHDAKSLFVTQHTHARQARDSMCYFSSWFLDAQARAIHRMGAPVDCLYRFDLKDSDVERYRLFLMVNVFYLTDSECSRLREVFADSGATVVWYYAPGFVSEAGLDTGQMNELTGFSLEEIGAGPMLIESDADAITFGVDEVQSPRFHVTDEDVRDMGRWTDTGQIGFASREMDGYTSVYVGTAPLPPAILRRLAVEAGVTLWSDHEDIVVATAGTAMCVATSAGPRTWSLPRPMLRVGSQTTADQFDLDLETGDVELFT
ncbi:MAG: hypothetical protein HN712_27700 [Gemmatimonadetes bacterium]|jgi:hypothetical protein|nr:hypothetical protein [Gemmatimonadota bacterium]MBT6149416.1 hypothetical protein [Gemmatimonadota bacterium]MBT7864127.1 hypothetical protein [Gemmatimonadota bacterium]